LLQSAIHFLLTINGIDQNRATSSLHNDTRLIIDLIDENDEIPQFIGLDENGRYPGSVAENLEPGAEVITVTATDKDEFQEYRKACIRWLDIIDFFLCCFFAAHSLSLSFYSSFLASIHLSPSSLLLSLLL